jgi:hypothetical protein
VAPAAAGTEHVRIKDDRDLDAFVRSLARRLEHPSERAAVLAGRVRFSLSASAASSSPAPAAGGSHRIDRGAVTERVIERAAADYTDAAGASDVARALAANRRFHFALLDAAAQAHTLRILRMLWDSTEAYRALYYNAPAERTAHIAASA